MNSRLFYKWWGYHVGSNHILASGGRPERVRSSVASSLNKNNKKATQFTIEKKADQFAVETVEEDTNCNTEKELQLALECKEPFYDDYLIAFTEMIVHSFSCSEFSSQIDDIIERYESFNAHVLEHLVEGNDQKINPSDNLMDKFILHSLKPIGILKADSLKVLFDTGSDQSFIHSRC